MGSLYPKVPFWVWRLRFLATRKRIKFRLLPVNWAAYQANKNALISRRPLVVSPVGVWTPASHEVSEHDTQHQETAR